VISFTSNLSSLLLNNAACTSIYGDCYVVGDRIVINVTKPTTIWPSQLLRADVAHPCQ